MKWRKLNMACSMDIKQANFLTHSATTNFSKYSVPSPFLLCVVQNIILRLFIAITDCNVDGYLDVDYLRFLGYDDVPIGSSQCFQRRLLPLSLEPKQSKYKFVFI